MKKVLFCLVLILIVGRAHLSATPMGGEISYQCKGNGKYDVYLKIYRDCSDTMLVQSDLLAYCSTDSVRVSNQSRLSTRDITGLGSNCSIESKCSGTFLYGYEEIIWKMELDLSSYSCCEWDLAWEQCCRSSLITTGSANQNFYLKTMLNKCLSSCNSSPVFSRPPQILVCSSQDFLYNMGAMDTFDNGDSLSYSLSPGFQSASQQITYTGQWSPSRPLTFFGFPRANLPMPAGLRLDPITGDFQFRPVVNNQVAVVVIEVKEWRKVAGVQTVIGKTYRDFILHIVSCPNNYSPRLDPPYTVQACAGSRTCIQIASDDNDNYDSVTLSWENPIKGASFTNDNGIAQKASGQVCWTPHDSDERSLPYFFTVKASDNNCSLTGATSRAYAFFVNPSPKVKLESRILNCGQVTYDHVVIDSLNGFTFKYEVRDSQENLLHTTYSKADTITLPPGRHYLDLVIDYSNYCKLIARDTLDILDYTQVLLPKDTNLCIGDTLKLSALVNTEDSIVFSAWKDLITNQDTGLSDSYLSNYSSSDSRWSYRVTDSKGCSHSDSVDVHIRSLPYLGLKSYQAFCFGDTVKIDRGADSAGWSYNWSVGGSDQIVNVFHPKVVVLYYANSFLCRNNDTVRVNEMSEALNYVHDTSICEGTLLELIPPGTDSVEYYDYDTYTSASVPLYTGDSVKFIVNKTQQFFIKATNYKGNSKCDVYKSFVVSKLLLPPLDLGVDKNICNGDSIQLVPIVSNPSLDYQWSTGQSNQSIWVKDSGEYQLSVMDSRGCRSIDSLKIWINAETVDAGLNQRICLDDTVHLMALGADSFYWYDLASYVQGSLNNPVNTKSSYSYQVSQNKSWIVEGILLGNGLRCIDKDTVMVETLIWKEIQNIQGEAFPVDNIPSYTYSIDTTMQDSIYWSVINGTVLSGQSTGEIVVHWNNIPGTSIKVIGFNNNGCKSEYSKKIYVLKNSVTTNASGTVSIYPNPGKNQLNVVLYDYVKPLTYEIRDQFGRVAGEGLLSQKNNQLETELLSPGVYFLMIEDIGNLKFVVIN